MGRGGCNAAVCTNAALPVVAVSSSPLNGDLLLRFKYCSAEHRCRRPRLVGKVCKAKVSHMCSKRLGLYRCLETSSLSSMTPYCSTIGHIYTCPMTCCTVQVP